MRVVAAFLLALGVAGAAAQPAEALPFVDASGRVAKAPTYSDLVRALGEPPVSTVRPERWESPPRGRSRGGFWDERRVLVGGEHDIGYPQRGLSFTVDRTDRPLRDPPLRWMRIAAPASARLPQGLFVGQPLDEAVLVARRHFEVRQERVAAGAGVLELDDPNGGTRHRLWLTFERGTLRELAFDFDPPPTPAQRWALAGAMVGVVALAAAAFARWRERFVVTWPVPSARTAARVGAVIAWGGIALALGGTGALGIGAYVVATASNPYAGMSAVLLGSYALMALMGGAVLVAIGRRIASEA